MHINQDIIALKKVLKWAQNIRTRILKNINQIETNHYDVNDLNEFYKLNALYDSHNNFCLTAESEIKLKENGQFFNKTSNQNKPVKIQKTNTQNLRHNDESKIQVLNHTVTSTCQPDKAIEADFSRNCLGDMNYDFKLYEQFESKIVKELSNERKRVDELEEKMSKLIKKNAEIEAKVSCMESKVDNIHKKINEMNTQIEDLSKTSVSNHKEQMDILKVLLLNMRNELSTEYKNT
ncbi:unnamed protein product [Brachionus calyciflorus]|uniref:Uncharacterized protein n=1 Tax=Brachionus calyciflorus TaxID=104777 RepID=A0A813M1V4_9BILA|nr:unnamed protein product [Brachionus calyciflorus]